MITSKTNTTDYSIFNALNCSFRHLLYTHKAKAIAIVLLFSTFSLVGQTPKRPFPQADKWTPVGVVIKPNRTTPAPAQTQAQLNADVIAKYTNYKSKFLKKTAAGRYYIQSGGTGGGVGITVSEAHGYGMLTFALMAGYDPEAKTIFDGMNTFRKARRSTINADLMEWTTKLANVDNTGRGDDSATDGDMDCAYALLLAYYQWGDQAYMDDAKTVIAALRKSCVHASTMRIALGDWDSKTSSTATRSSDWMMGHFRAFYEVTGDESWLQVLEASYKALSEASNATTGLVSCFVTGVPAKPDPISGGTYEDDAEHYSYNACRVPWRLATEYLHYGEPRAKAQIDKITNWLNGKTGGNASNMKAGYKLDGTVLSNGNYEDLCFTAPFTAGMIANSANQAFLNDAYNRTVSATSINPPGNAYEAALQLLSMLVISGNWWPPAPQESTEIKTVSGNTSLQIYPNPVTNGIFSVEAQNQTQRIEICDLAGKLIHTQQTTGTKTEINISHLPDGVYIVGIGDVSAKIVKQ